MNLNKVMLVGRLTRDPEIRSTSSGQSVGTIGLATTYTWTDKNGQKQEKPEFHNLTLWGRTAEIAGQYLTKGQECYFEGRLQSRSYTGKDNVERKVTEIIVENMQMGSRPQGSAPRPATGQSFSSEKTPSYSNQGAPTGAKRPEENKPRDEEIPTINLDDEKDDIRIEDVPF
ncbi:MAG: single-stranded DNA-binding protein [Candidatus Moraniibacteriota bacterium]|nr:MAG: single-stranded DNA-binding protein [Candidatus Moranbacteria bacterium]